MKRRRLIIAVCSVASFSAVVMLVCLWPRREAVWNGKTCSQWFKDFRRAKVRHRREDSLLVPQIIAPTTPNGRPRIVMGTNYVDDTEALLSDPAADGLRKLGTNIIPVLTAEIRRRDSRWRSAYASLFGKLPAWAQRVVPNPPKSRDELRGDAALALTLLGADATPAWPIIFDAYIEASPYAQFRFMQSLKTIPFDSVGFDSALDSLVNRGDLSGAVSLVGQFGARGPNSMRILTNAILSTNLSACEAALSQLRYYRRFTPILIPALRAALKNSDQRISLSVIDVVEFYGDDGSAALPELVEILKSSDREARYRAARAIESMGTNALPAVPALLAAKSDSNEMVQRVVSRTLESLSSQTNY